MKKHFTLCFLGSVISFASFAQQSTDISPLPDRKDLPLVGTVYKKKLPDDLPQAKLLFIKHSPVPLPDKRPKDMPRGLYNMQENHNNVYGRANEQLVEAAARYPYAHRITTLDSVAYYRDHGYKYMLMQTSFSSVVNGTFRGTTGHGMGANRTYASTSVDLYVQDLANNDRYVFDEFSETFVYYYKGQVGMLLKKVDKQFKVKKS